MNVPIRKNIIFLIVGVISVLLVANVALTYYNNEIIKENHAIQTQVEKVKLYYDQIGKTIIHSLDIGLRGYYIVRTPAFVAPMDNAIHVKDSLLQNVEIPLQELHYSDTAYRIFKDSLNAYTEYSFMLKDLLIESRDEEFRNIFRADKGAHLWWQYEQLENNIKQFLNKVDEQAQKKYAEAAEAFTNTVYEQSDSLKPVADKLKLEIRTAQGVARTPQPGATGPLANAKFLQALFSADALERKRNTEAIEIAPNQMVSGRVVQHQPARARPFEEVKAQVREQVVNAKAAELARKDGAAKLAAWKAAPASATLPGAESVSRMDKGRQPPEVVEAALRADPGQLPALVGVDLGANGYAVVKINRVLPREAPPPAQAQQEQQQYTRAWSAAEAQAYYELLKDRFKVQVLVEKPRDSLTQ